MTKLIVLDCDGVLLDYNTYYGKMYERIFNKKIEVINHNSYHAENYYGLSWENSQQKDHFLRQFNLQGWHDMSALEGAVEATQTLKQQGYKIIILTSIPPSAQEKRHQNLLDLGMPIDATIACGGTKEKNPKKAYIEALNPLYFVDDLKDNFHGIQSTTKHVLIHGNHDDSPNKNAHESIKIHHTVSSLKEFVDSKFKQKKK